MPREAPGTQLPGRVRRRPAPQTVGPAGSLCQPSTLLEHPGYEEGKPKPSTGGCVIRLRDEGGGRGRGLGASPRPYSAAVHVLELRDTLAAPTALLRSDERHAGLVLEDPTLDVVELAEDPLQAGDLAVASRSRCCVHDWLLEFGIAHEAKCALSPTA